MSYSENETRMIGRLTRDPEVNYTAGGKAITKFGVVTNRSWKQGDEWKEKATFSDWVMWNGAGESFAKGAGKGDQVIVKGEFGLDEWNDAEGNKRSRPVFTALFARVLMKSGAGKSGNEATEASDSEEAPTKPAAKKRGRPAAPKAPEVAEGNDDSDEDSEIPF